MNVVKCTNCGRLTPTKHGECIYCQGNLSAKKRPVGAGHEEPRVLGGRSKRFTRRSDDRTHYLIVGSREPIVVEPGKLFVIGRDSRASLVVHAPDVSRQHAEIEWDDHDPPRPLLCEIRSSNGTYLNGRRVTRDAPMPLRGGDEVRLGETFSFSYLHCGEHELKRELEERGRLETRRFRKEDGMPVPDGFPAAAPVSAPLASGGNSGLLARDDLAQLVSAMSPGGGEEPLPLEGSLATISGGDLLRRLHSQGSSGVLALWSGPHTGELLLQEGRCTRAVFASLTGRVALEHVAGLIQGLFRFSPEAGFGAASLTGGSEATSVIPTIRHGPPIGATLRVGPRPSPNEGDMAAIGGHELLRRMESEARSGVLVVQDAAEVGEVVWTEGRVEMAQLGPYQGQDALDYLATMRRGTWRFRPHTPAPAAPPYRPTRAQDPGSSGLRPRAALRAATPTSPNRRVMPLRKEQAPENRRPPLRPPSGSGPLEEETRPAPAQRGTEGHGSSPFRRPAPPPPVRPTPTPATAPRQGGPRRRPPPLPQRPE